MSEPSRESLSTNPTRRPRSKRRRVAGGMLVLAAGAVLVAVFVGDEALAGSPKGLVVTPVEPDEPSEPWTAPGEIDRLSIPLTLEEQGFDANELPDVPVDAPTYIFVNMDGTTLAWTGGDSSVQDSSVIAYQYGFQGAYPAYGGTAAQRQSVPGPYAQPDQQRQPDRTRHLYEKVYRLPAKERTDAQAG